MLAANKGHVDAQIYIGFCYENGLGVEEDNAKAMKLSGEDIKEGLTSVISIKVQEPLFEGQTKTKLGNSDVFGIVSSIVTESLKIHFGENPNSIKTIISKYRIGLNF